VVPNEFGNFFFASAGAGAALVGLLFVAISINPDRIFSSRADIERQAIAGSAFNALLNAFFVSLGALIPKTNLGYTALILSVVGLFGTLQLLRPLLKGWRDWLHLLQRLFWTALVLIMYGLEAYYSVDLINHSDNTDMVYSLAFLMFAFYGLGVVRAWQLLGAPRRGIFSFLSPLKDWEVSSRTTTESADSTTHSEVEPATSSPTKQV
jgi:hypothetical protein